MIRASAVIFCLVVVVAQAAPVAASAPEANVIGITYKQGSSSIDVVLAIPAHIYFAAEHANFGLGVAVTYASDINTVETADSGRASVAFDTVLLDFDDDTVVVLFKVPLGALPAPGGTPGFTATTDLLTPGDRVISRTFYPF